MNSRQRRIDRLAARVETLVAVEAHPEPLSEQRLGELWAEYGAAITRAVLGEALTREQWEARVREQATAH